MKQLNSQSQARNKKYIQLRKLIKSTSCPRRKIHNLKGYMKNKPTSSRDLVILNGGTLSSQLKCIQRKIGYMQSTNILDHVFHGIMYIYIDIQPSHTQVINKILYNQGAVLKHIIKEVAKGISELSSKGYVHSSIRL